MRTVLTALFLCLAILLGIVESASGKAITGPQNPYPEQKLVKIGEVTEEFESVGRIPHQEITIWFYDPATGVVFYVRQNPWTAFDPLGLELQTTQNFSLKEIRSRAGQLKSEWNKKSFTDRIKSLPERLLVNPQSELEVLGEKLATKGGLQTRSNGFEGQALDSLKADSISRYQDTASRHAESLQESSPHLSAREIQSKSAELASAELGYSVAMLSLVGDVFGPKTGNNKGHLVRFGKGPETAEKLAADAGKAEAAGFPHGVSTRLKDRVSGSDRANRSAPKSEVENAFDVQQTGKDPRHHTVVLPKPVTPDVADKFNEVFLPKTGE